MWFSISCSLDCFAHMPMKWKAEQLCRVRNVSEKENLPQKLLVLQLDQTGTTSSKGEDILLRTEKYTIIPDWKEMLAKLLHVQTCISNLQLLMTIFFFDVAKTIPRNMEVCHSQCLFLIYLLISEFSAFFRFIRLYYYYPFTKQFSALI